MPLPSTVAVPTELGPLRRVIVAPISPVPVNVGVVSLVLLSLLEDPVSDSMVRLGAEGASGAAVSIVTNNPPDARAETLPAVSV